MEGEAEGEWVVSARKKSKKQKSNTLPQPVVNEDQRGKPKNKKTNNSSRLDQGPRNFDKEPSSSTRSSSTSSSSRAATSKQNQYRKPTGSQDANSQPRNDSNPKSMPPPSNATRVTNKPPGGGGSSSGPLSYSAITNVKPAVSSSGTISYSAAAAGSAPAAQTQPQVLSYSAVANSSAADSTGKGNSASKPINAHSFSEKSETVDLSQKLDANLVAKFPEQKPSSDLVSTPSAPTYSSIIKTSQPEVSKPMSWSSIAGGKASAPQTAQESKTVPVSIVESDQATPASTPLSSEPIIVEPKQEEIVSVPKSEQVMKPTETIDSNAIPEEPKSDYSQPKSSCDDSMCNLNGSSSLSDSEVSDIANRKDTTTDFDEKVNEEPVSPDNQACKVDVNKNEVSKNIDTRHSPIDLNDSSASSKSGSQVNLKYSYKEDQWSPINLEGKRQYDRQFLMQLRNDPRSLEKPSNLPSLEIIKDRTSTTSPTQNNKDWTPGFVKGVSQKPSLTKRASRDGSKRSSANPSKVIDLQIKEVELIKSDNPWKPAKFQETQNGDTDDDVKALLRRARGILNKLCPQKFADLVGQFKELPIDTGEKLEACIELIFEKAVDEPGFSVAYAQMCDSLRDKKVMAVVPEGERPKPVNFRTILLERCRVEFERDYMAGLDRTKYEADLAAAEGNEALKTEIEADWMDKERRARRKSLGNIQFIGELYKLNMLSDKVMHFCIKKLIKSREEESLESLCRLLSTVGKALDEETKRKMESMSEEDVRKEGLAPFDYYFKEIEKLSQEESLRSRVRFMLQDVLDLRKDEWKPRRDVAGPKTREQIMKEVEREKTQQQLKDELMVPRNREREISGGSNHSREVRKRAGRHSMQAQISEDGWTSIQPSSRLSQKYEVDTNKITNLAQMSSKRIDSDNLQLGPGSRSGWGQGSSSQRRSIASFDSTQVNTRNKFSMLNVGESDNPRYEDWHDQRYGAGGSSKSMILHSRNSRGPSSEQEKLLAIEAVRQTLNGPREHNELVSGPTASIGPQMTFKRPVPESILQVSEVLQQAKLLEGTPNVAEIEVRKQANLIIDDYLTTGDLQEAIDNVCKWLHPTTIELFVQIIIDNSLEKLKEEEIFKVGTLFSNLIERNILLKKQLQDVLNTLLKSADDLSMDIPKLWTYLGEILAPGLQTKVLPMSFLTGHELDKESAMPSKFFAGAINSLLQISSVEEVRELWRSSGLTVNEFVDNSELERFIESNKLEFLLDAADRVMTPERVAQKLSSLLKNNVENDVIFTWIEENVEDPRAPWFIRAATAIVVENTTTKFPMGLVSDKENFKRRSPILRRYIDSKFELEVQALFAVHHLMHKLEHPRQLLQSTFENLLDDDIVSEEAFFEWEKSDDPAEMEGKGVAINETKGFFKWLRDASEEDDENVRPDDDDDGYVS